MLSVLTAIRRRLIGARDLIIDCAPILVWRRTDPDAAVGHAGYLNVSHAPYPQERRGTPRCHQVLHALVALAGRRKGEACRVLVEHGCCSPFIR